MAMGSALRSTAWTARLGLMVLLWLVIGLATGVPLFFGRRGWWDPTLQPLVLALHLYASTLSVPFVLAKIWGTWQLLRHAPPGREAPAFDRAASAALIAFALILYGSGILLTWNAAFLGNAWLKDVHLYSTLATVAPLTWHLIRRFLQSWRIVRNLSVGIRPGSWNARLYSRRALLTLVVAAGLSWMLRRALPAAAGEDPNDFPVTNFGPAAGSIDLATWRLEVRGAVANPLSLSYEDLLRLPRERHRYSLDCVTGWSATRDWEGVPVARVLEMAQPTTPEALLRFVSLTGYETTMSSRWYRRPGAMLATHVAGVPFTHDHGFPLRVLVPGVVGEENVKWLKAIEVLSP